MIIIIKLLIGLFFVVLGSCYIYAPHIVSKFNRWVRDNIATDRLLILRRRRTGLFLIVLGVVLLIFLFK
ncbi:MAG: hypothetical protein PF545_02725 [Elusimicrobia bacterium]|jgi:uncharacterized protein YjeT (DUF2065 family)|nr:hypothetical protein [Elusimicrobiota bacterium]